MKASIRSYLVFFFLAPASFVGAQNQKTPLRQSSLTIETPGAPELLTLRDAARDDRWLGVGIGAMQWAPDGNGVYFRWHLNPSPDDHPDADRWFFVDRAGQTVREVPLDQVRKIPPSDISWSRDGARAAWANAETVYLFDAGKVQPVVTSEKRCRHVRLTADGETVHFMMGEDLFVYEIEEGLLRQITRKHEPEEKDKTEAGEWLEAQQLDLFELHRRRKANRDESEALGRQRHPERPQVIPVSKDVALENIQVSPDGRFVTFSTRKENSSRPPTRYIDFVSESGYAEVDTARSKVGEPIDERKLGIVALDPLVDPTKVEAIWVSLHEAGDRPAIVHGPWWNLEGNRAVIQVLTEDHKDLWIADLDVETGKTKVLAHDRDDAWLGGPPIQPNYFQPTLLEWLPGDRFVFASERSGWSHLNLVEPDGTIRALTAGEWEVRGATLSRDRSFWLIQAGREHPCEDHLYTLPAAGGEMVRLTAEPGRHEGLLSPDGKRMAVVFGDSVHLPDLFLRDVDLGSSEERVTVSGTDNYYRHPLAKPVSVSFPHTDGRLLWASLFKPDRPNPERAAVLHIHGGGYRQFSHRGWTVYGYGLHLGAINYLVQQGYTVLDFDYRGSAGFGRDYRTDIYRSMGTKDIDGMVTAVKYLEKEHGVDPNRVGVYGISYGGFATLMALFRYPGVFAAGVANASVTDWAHYNHSWTSRILNLPYDDEEAYRRSSPIYFADGLDDPLLIVHGLIDDNVHFQDAARLVQKLIELEKDFDVMVYPTERHTIETEASRYDYMKRLTGFFDEHLLRR